MHKTMNLIRFVFYMGSRHAAKRDQAHIIKLNFCYKTASRLNRYNFGTVQTIDYLFSALLQICLFHESKHFCHSNEAILG